jgi:flagellar protein FlgJ
MDTNTAASVYTDFNGLAELKGKAREDSGAARKEVARQFEAMFVQMMMKSMREASLGEGILDSDNVKFYQDIYDQQLAIHLSESGGIGLAEVIERQLGGQDATKLSAPETDATQEQALFGQMPERLIQRALSVVKQKAQPESVAAAAEKAEPITTAATVDPAEWKTGDFVQQLMPAAQEAAAKLGLTPMALLAQAALETGWGKHVMRFGDGTPANNMFGIKADRRWDGEQLRVGTLEYEQGVAVRKKEGFRAYESFRDSFNDYVDFLRSNPRYEQALKNTDDPKRYFVELQKAGYATDPRYAEKITAVMEGPEMRRALQQLKNGAEQSL